MHRDNRISVCLPCRNEAENLPEVIGRLPDFVDEVIVVSNGSTDDTVAVVQSLGVKVVEDDRAIGGIGYGFAHMTGIELATGDIIVGVDADGTYPVEELDRAIDHLLDHGDDFVSCNRFPVRDGTSIPPKLRLGVWLLNKEVRLLYGYRVNDILSGMWIFRREVAPDLRLTMGDWNLSPQIKLNALTSDAISASEFGIVQHQRLGTSHQRYFHTGISHAWWILTNRFRDKGRRGRARRGGASASV